MPRRRRRKAAVRRGAFENRSRGGSRAAPFRRSLTPGSANRGPPEKSDEKQLKGNPRDERRRGRATDGDPALRGVDVRRQHREKEDDERDGGDPPRARNEESDRPEDLADAGDRHHELRVGDRRRHHPDHVRAHAVEVGGRREEEHDREADARRGGPVPEGRHSEPPGEPGEQGGEGKDDQRSHAFLPTNPASSVPSAASSASACSTTPCRNDAGLQKISTRCLPGGTATARSRPLARSTGTGEPSSRPFHAGKNVREKIMCPGAPASTSTSARSASRTRSRTNAGDGTGPGPSSFGPGRTTSCTGRKRSDRTSSIDPERDVRRKARDAQRRSGAAAGVSWRTRWRPATANPVTGRNPANALPRSARMNRVPKDVSSCARSSGFDAVSTSPAARFTQP